MDRMDRLQASFTGAPVDRRAYAIWRHFPNQDRTPEAFANAHVTFQKAYDPDVLKLSPHGLYCAADWGVEIGPVDPVYASPVALSHPIKTSQDYRHLPEVDPTAGEFGRQLDGLRLVAKALEGKVPLMMTVFCPLMIASILDPKLGTHLATDPTSLHHGLSTITKVITEFGRAAIDAGADGLFVASRYTVESIDTLTSVQLTEPDFLDFEVAYTMKTLQALRSHAKFLVFHVHGDRPRFRFVAEKYPVDAINWHSAHTTPPIPEALKLSSRGLFAGIDEADLLRRGSPAQIKAHVESLLHVPSSRLILAPGCVVRTDTPPDNLRILVDTIRASPPIN